jgi:foldase protein PrsA
MTGCSQSSNTETRAIAATLTDGTNIYEDDVSDYIDTYRQHNQLEDDDTWNQALEQSNYSSDVFRTMTIYELAAKSIIADEAANDGITITDDQINDAITQQKQALGVNDDDTWNQMLDTYGIDAGSFWDTIAYRLKEEAVYKDAVSQSSASDDQALSYLTSNYGGTTAHYMQCISNTSTSTLSTAYDQLEAQSSTLDSAGFSSYVQTYSDKACTDNADGSLGWDIQYGSSSDIASVFTSMQANELYGDMYTFGDGEKGILFCGQTFDIPTTLSDTSSVPSTLLSYARKQASTVQWNKDCKAWLQQQIEDSITINDMPDGLAYATDK